MDIILRGNLERLVTAYARLDEPIRNNQDHDHFPMHPGDQLFVMYLGNDPYGFFTRIDAPTHTQEAVKHALGIEPPTPDSFAVYGSFVPLSCEDKIREGIEDVIHCDDQDYPSAAIAAVESALGVYLFFHTFSTRNRDPSLDADEIDWEEEDLEDWEIETLTYQDIPKQELADHLMETYGLPLLHAYHEQDRDALVAVKHDLSEFVKGTAVSKDIKSFCDEFLIGRPLDHHLVNSYVDKICAIIDEDYDKAAQLRDFIDEYKNAA